MLDRLLSKIRHEGTCWIWTASVMSKKAPILTPAFKYNGKVFSARKVVYELLVGEVLEENTFFSKTCGNDLCVNPEHAKLISGKDHVKNAHKKQQIIWEKILKKKKKFQCGHAYKESNFYFKRDGRSRPSCRECKNVASRDWKRKKREQNKQGK